jgi:hypothetical protein
VCKPSQGILRVCSYHSVSRRALSLTPHPPPPALQVAGWRIDYEGLSFVTVRNAGHMVGGETPTPTAFTHLANSRTHTHTRKHLNTNKHIDTYQVPYVQPERAYHMVADFLKEAAGPAPSSAA